MADPTPTKKAKTDAGAEKLMEVPVLDMQNFFSDNAEVRDKFIEDLGQAFQQLGFVRLVGHGIEQSVIDEVYKISKDLFYLDEATKMKYHLEGKGGARGYTPFGKEHAKGNEKIDLKEFWHVGQDVPKDHEHYGVYGDNVWPEELPEFKPKTMTLFRDFEKAAGVMLRALAIYCKVDADFFEPMVADGNSILRLIYYPATEKVLEAGAIRAAQHEDINLITLLPTATAAGLQILRPHDNQWIDVKDAPGEIIVDSGDMMARLTNNVLPATTHRVINPEDTKSERFSMPFFMHPHPKGNLDPSTMPHISSQGKTPMVEPILAGDFLEQRLKEIGLKK